MKTIVVATPKGGTGKSGVVASLAWRAAGCPAVELDLKQPDAPAPPRVVMIDLNEDQGTLTQWWTVRGRPSLPYLFKDGERLDEDIAVLREDGWAYCFIDTPPLDMQIIETAVYVADAVVVPLMAAFFDTSAIDSIVDMCKRRRKPFAFLFNSFDKRKPFKAVNNEAMTALRGRGPIFQTKLSYSPKYREGQIEGRTGAEMDPKNLKPEIDALWLEVQKLAGISAPDQEGRP